MALGSSPIWQVKDRTGKALKGGVDYNVSYPKGMKNVGKYTVKVTFKENYKGSKSLTYSINPKGVPAYLRLLPLRKALRSLGKSRKPRPQVIKCSTAQTRTLRKTTRPLPSARTAPPLRAWAS